VISLLRVYAPEAPGERARDRRRGGNDVAGRHVSFTGVGVHHIDAFDRRNIRTAMTSEQASRRCPAAAKSEE
jgi:hypothetical protein